MEEKELNSILNQVKDRYDPDTDYKQVEYLMDFGTVSVLINMSYN